MRRFKLRRHMYKPRTTTPDRSPDRRRTDREYSLEDPKWCEGARRAVLGIVSGRFQNGKKAMLIGSSRENYQVIR